MMYVLHFINCIFVSILYYHKWNMENGLISYFLLF